MKEPNDIEEFKRLLGAALPGCTAEVDPPHSRSGSWWIETGREKTSVTLEYRHGRGFGIFAEESGYGEGPAEVYKTPELAVRRIVQLLAPGRANGPSPSLTLKDVRELYGCSQLELAEKVGVKQAAISRFENRTEVKLTTLDSAIRALGGELEIRARFPDSMMPISVGQKRKKAPAT